MRLSMTLVSAGALTVSACALATTRNRIEQDLRVDEGAEANSNSGIKAVVTAGPAAVPALLDIIKEYRAASVAYRTIRTQEIGEKHGIRARAITALGLIMVSEEDASAIAPVLEGIARDSEDSSRARGNAIEGLARNGTALGVEALARLFTDFQRSGEKERFDVIAMLAQTPNAQGREILKRIASIEDPLIQKYVGYANEVTPAQRFVRPTASNDASTPHALGPISACAMNRTEIEKHFSTPGEVPQGSGDVYSQSTKEVLAQGDAIIPALAEIIADYRATSRLMAMGDRSPETVRRTLVRSEAVMLLGQLMRSGDVSNRIVPILESIALDREDIATTRSTACEALAWTGQPVGIDSLASLIDKLEVHDGLRTSVISSLALTPNPQGRVALEKIRLSTRDENTIKLLSRAAKLEPRIAPSQDFKTPPNEGAKRSCAASSGGGGVAAFALACLVRLVAKRRRFRLH